MIENLELARMGVGTAQVITWTAFGAITLATLAGAVEGARPGTLTQVDTWVTIWAPKALSVALSALYVLSLAWVAVWTYRLAVTYLHVPTIKPARHRYSMVTALIEGTYSANRPGDIAAHGLVTA